MTSRINLDMDMLRSFAAGVELGSFARAADRLGRSQSALSTRLHKLETQLGQSLMHKSGRGLALTPAGENLLSYARRILDLNDAAVEALTAGAMSGTVRLGLPQDFAEAWLPPVLGSFARAHPDVQMELRTERNAVLVDRIATGELDLALAWGDDAGTEGKAELLARLPIVWIAPPGWAYQPGTTLPLVVFEPPCAFRSTGLAALDQAGIAWRVACTSPSLAGLWAATEAGLGITLRTTVGVPASLAVLDPRVASLPVLSGVDLMLHGADRQPAAPVARLAEILRGAIAALPRG